MCSGCDWPSCGGGCGTQDEEFVRDMNVTFTCECGNIWDQDVVADCFARGSYATWYACATCPKCNEEVEAEGDIEPSYDDYVPDDDGDY